jgi:hypothetical protein
MRAIPGAHPAGNVAARRCPKSLPAILSNLEVLILRSPINRSPAGGGPFVYGWGTRIRTWVGGVRVRSPTARRSPNRLSNYSRETTPCRDSTGIQGSSRLLKRFRRVQYKARVGAQSRANITSAAAQSRIKITSAGAQSRIKITSAGEQAQCTRRQYMSIVSRFLTPYCAV